jgi:basic membrane lipoprotein Med (substrate-binding protein (PBP1-ABC) superfamily)
MTSTNRCTARRLLALAVPLALLAGACGDDDDTGTAEATAEPAAAEEDLPTLAIILSGQVNDYSWNQAAYDGAEKLEAEGVIGGFAYQESVADADVERAARAYAEDGYDVVVAHSFNYGEAVKALAPDYPDVLFAYAGGFGDSTENVADYAQPFHETAYLQGILTAGLARNDVVAGAAGFDIPVCKNMFERFLDGAKLVNPDADGTYVAVGDWNDVQKGKETALGQVDAGAEMFIGCGQGPTLGQIEAAKEEGGYVTGYVGDMTELAPDVVLTSTVWRLDEVFAEMVADAAAGEVNPAEYYEITFAEGGMDIAINPELEGSIDPAAMEIYEAEMAKMRSGELTVPFEVEG